MAASGSTARCRRDRCRRSTASPVPPRVALDWTLARPSSQARPATAKHLSARRRRRPKAGDVVRFPALAATLRAIAEGGARAFYEGDDRRRHRGDAASARRRADRRGFRRASRRGGRRRSRRTIADSTSSRLPPNGQGLAALVMLNILERFDMGSLDAAGAERLHLLIEAGRLAYAVRNTHIADPAFMQMPVSALLDRGFAAKLAGMIDPTKRSPFPTAPKPQASTVLCLRGRPRPQCRHHDQFAVLGLRLRHRDGEDRRPAASPRLRLQPRSRPSRTASARRSGRCIRSFPALALRDGRVDMAFGVMGGAYQAMGHAHVVSNIIDYGMDLQAATRLAARVLRGRAGRWWKTASAMRRCRTLRARAMTWPGARCRWRRPGDPDRLGSRRADRRLRSAQGRLRAGILARRGFRSSSTRTRPSFAGFLALLR